MQVASSLRMELRRGLSLAAIAVTLGVGLAGCKSTNFSDITGSIGGIGTPDTAMPRDEAGLRRFTQQWGKRYEANPGDRTAAIQYARGLRMTTQYAQAVAVMEQIAVRYPNDAAVLGAYGKALADAGRLQEAADVLQRAHAPDRPNWSILSAQGSVADQMGDHASAQAFYEAALKIVPGEPTVMSNLGLSYALSKQLPRAEEVLRAAAAQPRADARVRQNLALVLSLEAKFKEAEQVSSRDLPPEQAAADVTSIRRMIAQSNTWRQMQSLAGAERTPRQSGNSMAVRSPSAAPATRAPQTADAAQN